MLDGTQLPLMPTLLTPPFLPPAATCSQIWMHTRCYHIPDEDPVPETAFLCDTCNSLGGGPEAAAAARAALHNRHLP